VIGVIPQGGNVVDAVRVDITRDGSGGGIAALRAIGNSGNNDFLDFKGIGIFPVDADVDPDTNDGVDCATTYVLAPGSNKLSL
jgi:hypothetical protein